MWSLGVPIHKVKLKNEEIEGEHKFAIRHNGHPIYFLCGWEEFYGNRMELWCGGGGGSRTSATKLTITI